MANSEHLKILQQGVQAWNTWRSGADGEDFPDLRLADLQGTNLEGANLEGAKLQSAKLQSAKLQHANLEGANLQGAHLERAYLQHAKLQHAKLQHAELQHADLNDSYLEGANLEGADLEGAELHWANLRHANVQSASLEGASLYCASLQGANLDCANLEGADLQHAQLELASLLDTVLINVRGLRLDGNLIRGAKFSPRAPDPWSIVRRNYTGSRLLFHLLLLVIFVLPYFGRIFMWAGVNQAQKAIIHTTTTLEVVTDELQDRDDPNAEALAQVTEQLSELQPCFAEDCERYYVWEVLLGVDRGPRYWLLAIALLTYNLLRALLTWSVGPLREEEERTDYAPDLKSYLWLFYIHRAVSLLLLVAVVAFVFNAYQWLSMTVMLPG